MAANEQPKRLQITRIRWAKSRYVRNLWNQKNNATDCYRMLDKCGEDSFIRFWDLENKNLEEQKIIIWNRSTYQSCSYRYICVCLRSQSFLIPKPSNFIPNGRMSWTCVLLDGKTTKLSLPRSLLVLLGCCCCMFFLLLFFLADPSIYRISQYESDDFMTTLRQPKNWKRQESLVTSREEVGDPQGMWVSGSWKTSSVDVWSLEPFYGGKFCNAVTYKFVFWNLWNLVNPFITVWTWHTKLIGLICLSFGCRWSRFAEVTRGLADIGCPACDPDIFPLKIWMNRQCMKSCGGNCCRFWAWYGMIS